MTRKILILDGHPEQGSYCEALTKSYAKGAARAGHDVRVHRLAEMTFDPDFGTSDFKKAPPLEPDLQAFWDDLVWCDHLVLAHPLWWGGLPARLKGLFDRALLPGKAFKYNRGKDMPDPLLKGRSSRILMTSDTPPLFFRWIYGSSVKKQTQRQILKFVGFAPNRFSQFASMIKSTPDQRKDWLDKVEDLGRRAA
ncbi:NAD(P)H-dependent oxidoreductase [Labrenzia sp. CE80]|uniref:NAD(P)H-dependent oxidoreductase n=1 Tax=Labrenzia sp. CE80 TaxID=1788986 RepID=UPI00129BA4F9|nr:NAD(P)H-dependent oxidoreductase [Labrenzia sp. CE80]